MNFYMKSIPSSTADTLVDIHTQGVTIDNAKYYKEDITENIVPGGIRSIKSTYTFYSGKTLHQHKVEQLFRKRR